MRILRRLFSNRSILILLFIVGFAISLPDLMHPMIAEADAYSRSLLSAQNKASNLIFKDDNYFWLPLHFTILTIPLFLYDNIYLTPRLTTLLFSASSVVMLYFFTKSVTKSQKVSFLASTLYLIFPMRLVLSTQTLSEPIFTFFLITSFYFFFEKRYLLSVLFLNLAHGVRYDSWFLIPIFIVSFFVIFQKFRKKVLYSLLTILFPIIHLWLNNVYYDNPIAFVLHKSEVAQQVIVPEYHNVAASISTIINRLELVFPLSFVGLGVLGAVLLVTSSYPNSQLCQYIAGIIPFYLLATICFLSFLGFYDWYPLRYFYIVATFSIPLISYSLTEIFRLLRRFISRPILIGTIILLTPALTFLYLRSYFFSNDYFTIGSFANGRIGPNDLLDLVKHYKSSSKNPNDIVDVKYLYKEPKRYWLEHAFYYFAGTFGEIDSIPQSDIIENLNLPYKYYVVEKFGESTDIALKDANKTIYENAYFFLLEH